MLDDINLVESDDELSYTPTQIKSVQQSSQAKTIQEKRENFRFQIRKEQIEEQLERKRMWFQPKQRFPSKDGLPCISVIFAQFRAAYQQDQNFEVARTLHLLANIIDDRNRIHSLYLTQKNFLQFKKLLLEETYHIDCFTIYSQLTQDEEFFTLNIEDIQWSIEQSLRILAVSAQDDLSNLILGYLANVASKRATVQHWLLGQGALLSLRRFIRPTLVHNVNYLIQTLCAKIPSEFVGELTNALLICSALPESDECLQTFYVVVRQADFDPAADYKRIMTFLFSYVSAYLKDEQDFESFYSALVQLKRLSDYHQQRIVSLFLQFSVLDIIQRLVSYRYQKIRTAGLHILQNLCRHNLVISRLFQAEDLLKKLVTILTSDKPVNQSLVLKAILQILKYGRDADCAKLLELGLSVHLQITLESPEPYLLLQGIDCAARIMDFGLQFQHLNIPNPYLKTLQNNQVIQAIDKLQQHPNQEVFEQAQKFIHQYFKVEVAQ